MNEQTASATGTEPAAAGFHVQAASASTRRGVFRFAPWLLLAVCAGMSIAGVAGAAAGVLTEQGAATVLALVPAGVGALIASRLPRNPLGWILIAVAIFFAAGLLAEGYVEGHDDEPRATATIVAAWFAAWTWIPAITLGGGFLPLLFPSGSLPSRRWRPVAMLAAAAMVIGVLVAVLHPQLDQEVPAPNPTAIPALKPILDVVVVFVGASIIGTFIAAAASQVRRFRGAVGEEREQLKWFAYVGCFVGAGMFFAFLGTLVHTSWAEVLGNAGWVVGALGLAIGLPLAIGVAILRYRLYDIDWIINRTLVYVPLTALLAGVFIALTGILRSLLSERTAGHSDAAVALTTIIVVATLTPAKNYLQERVDRHFKDSPQATKELDRIATQAHTAAELIDNRLFLQGFIESTARALQAPGVVLRLDGDGSAAAFSCGEISGPASITLPFAHENTSLGTLEIGLRRNGRAYSADELSAIERSLAAAARVVVLKRAAEERGAVFVAAG